MASEINFYSFYSSVIRLNELSHKWPIGEKIITISCKNAVFDLLCFINLAK